MPSSGSMRYYFGDFTLELEEHRLHREGREISLRPKSYETLLCLLKHSGRLVTKEKLLNTVWGETIVSDTSLSHCIEEIRAALGDDVHQPRYIKTVPRLGYKFISPVRQNSPQRKKAAPKQLIPEPANPPPAASPKRPYINRWIIAVCILALGLFTGYYFHLQRQNVIRSVVVLPFINLSSDSDQEYFVDGITEALIARLARLEGLRVISRTSAMHYRASGKTLPAIADELEVDAVVEGSVVRSADKVSITAQLIQARNERHLWANSYERPMDDIIALQNELAQAIAREIDATLSNEKVQELTGAPSTNAGAYQAYLKGRYFLDKRMDEGFSKGLDFFQQAIDLDPRYAPAWAGMADGYNLLNNYDLLRPDSSAPRARAAALQALKLDPQLAEAHASLAFIAMYYEWDWAEAESELKKAMALNANNSEALHWHALYLAMNNRFESARTEIREALRLDPVSLIITTNSGWLYYFEGEYDKAIAQYKAVLEMDPTFVSAHVKLGWAYEQTGAYDDAIAEFRKALELLNGDNAVTALLGHAYAMAGRKAEARQILDSLLVKNKTDYISPYLIACIHAGLGEKEAAISWLQKAHAARSGWLSWLKVDPKLKVLRDDPRFGILLRQVGLQ